MKQTYITSVSSDNLSKENICGWIINLLLMQKWGEAPHSFLADLTSYVVDKLIIAHVSASYRRHAVILSKTLSLPPLFQKLN